MGRSSEQGNMSMADGTVLNRADFLYENTTALNQRINVEPTTQFAYKSVFPISKQRDNTTETNNATVTQQNGSEYRVRATADAGSIGELQTKQNGDYIPGYIFVGGLAVRIPSQPSGNGKIEWGYFNTNNGHLLRYDANGLTYRVRKAGTETEVATLDHDPSSGYIYWFPMMYYGYAWAGVSWAEQDNEGVHRMQRKATYYPEDESMFDEANLPLTVRVESDGEQLDAFVAGRHMSVEGKNDRIFRTARAARKEATIANATDYVPMVSVQMKSAFSQIYTELGNITVIPEANLEFAIIRNGTLTGDSFGTPGQYNSDEIATDWDTSATAISGGEEVWGDTIQGGTGAQANFAALDLPDKPIVDGDIWSFCLRRISGTTDTTATLNAKVRENW